VGSAAAGGLNDARRRALCEAFHRRDTRPVEQPRIPDHDKLELAMAVNAIRNSRFRKCEGVHIRAVAG